MVDNYPTLGELLARIPAATPAAAPPERSAFGAGLTEAYGQLRYGVPHYIQQQGIFDTRLTPEEEAGYQQGRRATAAQVERQLPGGATFDLSSPGGVWRTAKEQTLFSLPQMAATLGGTLAGYLAGGPAGAVAGGTVVGTPFFIGSNVDRATNSGQTPLTKEAADRIGPTSIGQAGLDTVSQMFLPGMGKVFGKLAPKFAGKIAGRELGMLGRVVKHGAAEAITEGTTEALQQAGERYTAGLPTVGKEAATEYWQAGTVGALLGGILGAPAGIRSIQHKPAGAVTNTDMTGATDEVLSLPHPDQFAPPPAPAPQAELQPVSPRPLGDVDDTMLAQAHDALTNKISQGVAEPQHLEQMQSVRDEMAQRGWQVPEMPAPPPVWADQVSTLLKGARNQDLVKAAGDEATLTDTVHQLMSDQDPRPSTLKVAERLGLVDETGNPTPKFDEITARKASASLGDNLTGQGPAVDPEWEMARTELLKDTRGQDVRALREVPDLTTLEDRVYQGLGAKRGEGATFGKSEPNVSASMETLSKKLGLTDENGDWTEKGREVAKRQPLADEDLQAAAEEHALAGPMADLFKQGARDAQAGTLIPQTTPEAQEAYKAGTDWFETSAVPEVATAAQSEALSSKLDQQTKGERTATTEVAGGSDLHVTAEQLQQQGLNARIDEALHPTQHEGEIVALKKMVANGAAPDQVISLLKQVQAGKATFAQPAPVPHVLVPASRAEVSGAVERRVLQGRVQQEGSLLKSQQPSKADQRAETAKAVQAKGILDELKAAADSKDISASDYARARQALARGDHAKAISYLPGHAAEAFSVRGEVTPEEARQIETALQGKDVHGVTQWLSENAPNGFHKMVADKVAAALKQLEKAHKFALDFRIVQPGDLLQDNLMSLNGRSRGLAISDSGPNGNRAQVYVNGAGMGGNTGMDYRIVLHELVHAATLAAMEVGKLGKFAGTQVGVATKQLTEVHQALKDHMAKREAEAKLGGLPLTDFEQDILAGRNNALDNPQELVSWALSDADMMHFLDSVPYKPNVSLWDKLVGAVRTFLKLGKGGTALEEVLQASEALMSVPRPVGDVMYGRGYNASRVAAAQRDVASSNQLVDNFTAAATSARNIGSRLLASTTGKEQFTVAARKLVLEWNSGHHLSEFYGKWFDGPNGTNGLKAIEEHTQQRQAITARFAQMWTTVRDAYDALLSAKSPSAQAITQLMKLSEFGIDPTKTWEHQSPLVRQSTNQTNLQALTAEGNKLWRALQQRGHDSVYSQLVNTNDTMWLSSLAVSLHHMVAMDPALRQAVGGFSADPMAAFMSDPELHENPSKARTHWHDMVKGQVAALKAYLDVHMAPDHLRALPQDAAQKVMRQLTPLQNRVKQIDASLGVLDQAPYFHLGRFGDFFLGFNIAKDADGVIDPKALGKIGDYLSEKGFDGIQMSPQSTKGNAYIRVENADALKNLSQAVSEMIQQGLIEPDSVTQGKRGDENALGFVRTEMFDHQVQLIEADTNLTDDDKARMVGYLRSAQMEMMPENSLARVMTARSNVPGYSADMMRNFDWRMQVHTSALAGMSVAPQLTRDFTEMRAAVHAAEHDMSLPHQQRIGMRQVLDEMSMRERDRMTQPQTPGLDALRALGHTWFLGMSPSYVAVNLTQLGATLWPELTKRFGAMNAAKAIAKATPLAFKIIKATFQEGRKISLARASDAVVTQQALARALGGNTALAKFIMDVANTGNLDIGGAAREMGRSAEGRSNSKFDKLTRYASSMGYYSETLTRLIAAIATRELHGGEKGDVVEKASHVLNESMWNYSRANQARAVGKSGIFGRFSPAVFTFYQYTMQLTEKLYREVDAAFMNDAKTSAEKKAARAFLGSHLAAMTVMAGTMGLPLTTVLASVFDRLKDLFDDDDQPSDVRSAYRNYLASMLGVDAAEMVAHGAFRGAGIDISSRIGEQDLLPFSRFLTDRRKWDDRVKDAAVNTWGAPTSMVADWAKGAGKIMDGDFLGGMQSMVPNALKGPLKAYQLSEQGYIDAQGNRLPISGPGALTILGQALGFNPAARAEYQEEKQAVAVRNDVINQNSGNIRKQLFKAIESGDMDSAREWLQQARAFDEANPGRAIAPSLMSGLLQRAKAREMAQSGHMPLNVNTKDLGARASFGYGNY